MRTRHVENGRRQHMASGASDESKPCKLEPSLHVLALYETQILYVEHRSFILAYMNKWSFFSTIRARNVYLFHPFHLRILRCNLMLWVLLFVKLRFTHHGKTMETHDMRIVRPRGTDGDRYPSFFFEPCRGRAGIQLLGHFGLP